MTDNEIKKALYKSDARATFTLYRKGYLYYHAFLKEENQDLRFIVPVADAGDADFEISMPAKLLIRYLNIIDGI